MRSFWLKLWSYWALWITLFSLLLALLLASGATLLIYLVKGAAGLDGSVVAALGDILRFWFAPAWSVALAVGTLLSLKPLFNRCIAGHQLLLYSCDATELIAPVSVRETLKLWRKWLFVTIWIIAVEVLLGALLAYASGAQGGVMAWFNIYWLYLFFLLSALISLPMMAKRCTMVKVGSC